jgi:hypothetical protein
MWLERRSDRRAAAWGAARGIRSRADVILPDPGYTTAVTAETARPALAALAVVTINLFSADPMAAATIIRQALPEAASDPAIDGKQPG